MTWAAVRVPEAALRATSGPGSTNLTPPGRWRAGGSVERMLRTAGRRIDMSTPSSTECRPVARSSWRPPQRRGISPFSPSGPRRGRQSRAGGQPVRLVAQSPSALVLAGPLVDPSRALPLLHLGADQALDVLVRQLTARRFPGTDSDRRLLQGPHGGCTAARMGRQGLTASAVDIFMGWLAGWRISGRTDRGRPDRTEHQCVPSDDSMG